MALHIEFIASRTLEGKTDNEKIQAILNTVRKDRILVLENALTPGEEKLLIEKTMSAVSKEFPGIEIATISGDDEGFKSVLIKFLGGKTGGLTVVGPSNLVRQVKRDPNKLSLLAGSK